MHAVRYLGALTRCKNWTFETCIKRAARQSRFGVWRGRGHIADVSLYKFIADHSRNRLVDACASIKHPVRNMRELQ
jgi:hypothetical protein